jgi:hypothetical protein
MLRLQSVNIMKRTIRYAAGFLLTASLAHGQSVKAAAEPIKQMDFLEILAKGGLMMFPLGLLSVITVILILLYRFAGARWSASASWRWPSR